jgi:hypothetical protein
MDQFIKFSETKGRNVWIYESYMEVVCSGAERSFLETAVLQLEAVMEMIVSQNEFETMFVMAHNMVWFSFEDVDASVVHGGECQLGRPHPGAAKAEVFL